MTTVALKQITTIYKKHTLHNWLFEDIKWYKKPYNITISFIILIGALIAIVILNYTSLTTPLLLTYILIVISVFLFYLFPSYKTKTKEKLNITVNKKLTAHWLTVEILIEKQRKIRKELVNHNVLTEDVDVDISLLDEYIILLEKESTTSYFDIKTYMNPKSIYPALYMIFGTITTLLFNTKTDFNTILETCLISLIILYSIIVLFDILCYLTNQILNLDGTKLKTISKDLNDLKATLIKEKKYKN